MGLTLSPSPPTWLSPNTFARVLAVRAGGSQWWDKAEVVGQTLKKGGAAVTKGDAGAGSGLAPIGCPL